MIIKSLENVTYQGKKYAVGGEFDVEPQVAYALGGSVEILENEPVIAVKQEVKKEIKKRKTTSMKKGQVKTK